MKIQDARRQGWEEGRKQGLEGGICGGEMEGPRKATSYGSLGINNSNMQRPSKQKQKAV